jgi:uncharacterized protein YjbJ (UPF0337 family)
MGATIDNAKGHAKEAAGTATGDSHLKHEGKADQLAATVKEKAGEAKDKIEDLAEKVKDKVHHHDK